MNLTPNFTLWEAFRSQTAAREKIDNTPPQHIIPNLIRTANLLEQVRSLLGNRPIYVSSWYRSVRLNAAVGGAARSQHMTGCAADFECDSFGPPVAICKVIIATPSIQFDQLILEHTWVHISVPTTPSDRPKMQVLSLLNGGRYSIGLTDRRGNPLP
jgi:zinc D-Ala-D-Ala carboxypeptidase